MASSLMRSAFLAPALFVAVGAAHATDVVSAQLAGIGGASLADPRDNSGITVNPATLSLIERYDIQGMFVGGPSGDLRWNASAVDGRTSKLLSFGLAYNGGILSTAFHPSELPGWVPSDETPVNSRQIHDITFGLAAPFFDRKLSIGLNGTLSIFKGDYVGSGVTGNIDLGAATRPVEWVTVGFVARNLLPIADQADIPTALALGVRGGKEDMILAAVDAQVRTEQVVTSPWSVRAGLEGTIKFAKLRAGWDWDGDRGWHQISWGLGLGDIKIGSIDYAMQIPLTGSAFVFADVTHTVSLTIRTKFGDKEAEEQPVRWPSEGGGVRR